MVAGLDLTFTPGPETIAPTSFMPEQYGSARLLTSASDDLTGFASPSGFLGFPLGHNDHDRSRGLNFDFTRNAGHGLFIGATRAGKFVNILAPALLTCSANAVVTDPKGQAYWETGPRREAMGFRVVCLDPWGEVQRRYGDAAGITVPVSRFNPLSALDPHSETFNDDVSTIADALTVVSPGQDSHWTDSARELIAGLIAAVVELDPGLASLRDVRELITAPDDTLVEKIVQIRAANPHSLAGRKLRRFAPKMNDRGELMISSEIGSIRSTAETQTAILDSEALLNAMETDDPPFDLAELITGKTTLYLVLPPDRLNTHGRWLRMILTLAIRTISRVGKSYQDTPCCFWLDEFSSLGNLRMIEDSYGLMAGLGVRVFAFLQDLSQLQRDYPSSWETFVSNSSLVMLLQCADGTTANYISDLLGTATINAKTGGSTYKAKPYPPGSSYMQVVIKAFTQHLMQVDGKPEAEAYQWANTLAHVKAVKQVKPAGPDGRNYSDWILENGAQIPNTMYDAWFRFNTNLQSVPGWEAYSKVGYSVWDEDTQPAARPVMLPQEVRDADKSKAIVIMPGVGNFQLQRWEYYSDPVFSPLARHDPNRPAPHLIPPPAPAPIAPPVAAPVPIAQPVTLATPPAATPPRPNGGVLSFLKDRGRN